jgi:hypothetical protein
MFRKMFVLRTNVGIVKVINQSKVNIMEKITTADIKLQNYFNGLLQMAEKTSKSSEDSILLAGAMMSAARVIYYDRLGPDEGQHLMDTNTIGLVETIKPTIH